MRRYGLIGGTQDDVLWLAKKSQAALPHIELRFGYEAGTAAVWMRPFNFESVRLRFHASDRRRLSSSLRRCFLMSSSRNSTEPQEANSNAMSLCVNRPPQRPAWEVMPTAPVFAIHCLGVSVTLLKPV